MWSGIDSNAGKSENRDQIGSIRFYVLKHAVAVGLAMEITTTQEKKHGNASGINLN